MSHVVEMGIAITDLDALAATAKAIGLELVRGQKTYKWYGRSVGDYPLPAGFNAQDLGRCEHAIRIPGVTNRTGYDAPYEIGVVKRRDGKPGYTLLWDFYDDGKGLVAKVGENGNKLKQEYQLQIPTRLALRRGLRIQREKGKDGHVILRAYR